jgi:hypothetical protein
MIDLMDEMYYTDVDFQYNFITCDTALFYFYPASWRSATFRASRAGVRAFSYLNAPLLF